MQFATPRMRRASEPALPMINVVFLLLIFFLMSAQISPPPPFDVTPPDAQSDTPAEAERVLYIAADGKLALGQARSEAVWDTLTALADEEAQKRLTLMVDGALAASRLAEVLARLGDLGFETLHLVTGGA